MLFTLLTMLCFVENRSCTTIVLKEDLTAEACMLALDVGIESVTLPPGYEIDTRGLGFVCALQVAGE